jgi:hypothetical protein
VVPASRRKKATGDMTRTVVPSWQGRLKRNDTGRRGSGSVARWRRRAANAQALADALGERALAANVGRWYVGSRLSIGVVAI